MKQSRKLCILSGVLLVICGITFGVSRYEQQKEEIKNSDETILSLSSDEVTALSWEYDDTKLAFHKDDAWEYDDDADFPVSEEKIEELLNTFEDFGASFIIENVEDYSQYGLDDPTCSIHIETSDQDYDIKMGNYSTMDEERYVSIGDGNVYLVSTDPVDTFDVELKDMIQNDETPEDIDKAESIVFKGTENYSISYEENNDVTYSDDDVYFTKNKKNNIALDTDTVENYFTTLENLGLDNYVTYNATEDELAEYGLDDPELTATIKYTSEDSEDEAKTFTISVSRSAEDKEKADSVDEDSEDGDSEEEDSDEEDISAYVRIGESSIIYQITESEYDSLMAVSINELRHQEIFWADFEKVNGIDVTLEGQTYSLTASGEDDDITWQYGDETVEIDDLETALTSLTATEFTSEETEGKEEISLTIYLNDDNVDKVQISIYRLDGTSCVAAVDGKNTALVSRTEVVDLIEAINGIVLK